MRQQLGDWCGQSVDQWELIHRCDIAHALPVQEPYAPLDQPVHSAGAACAATIGTRLRCQAIYRAARGPSACCRWKLS